MLCCTFVKTAANSNRKPRPPTTVQTEQHSYSMSEKNTSCSGVFQSTKTFRQNFVQEQDKTPKQNESKVRYAVRDVQVCTLVNQNNHIYRVHFSTLKDKILHEGTLVCLHLTGKMMRRRKRRRRFFTFWTEWCEQKSKGFCTTDFL